MCMRMRKSIGWREFYTRFFFFWFCVFWYIRDLVKESARVTLTSKSEYTFPQFFLRPRRKLSAVKSTNEVFVKLFCRFFCVSEILD